MRRLFLLSLLFAAPLAAHADPMTTFTIANGTFQSGGTFSGSFVLDTHTDLITSYSIQIDTDGFDLTVTENFNFGIPYYAHGNFQSGDAALVLLITQNNTSPALCTESNQCSIAGFNYSNIVYNSGANEDDVTGGTITGPASVTPEPASLTLLGTGVMALAAVARRRIFRS